MGSMLGPNRVIAKDVKSCTYCCYVRYATLIVWVGGMPWPQTGAIQYHVQLGLPDKRRAIRGLVVCNSWDPEPWDLLNGLAPGCYQPSPEVWLVCSLVNKYMIIYAHKFGDYLFMNGIFLIIYCPIVYSLGYVIFIPSQTTDQKWP